MTLLDTDKNSPDRSNPTPNSDDNIADGQRMAHGTISTSYKPTGTQGKTNRVQFINDGIIIYDGSNVPRIFIGLAPNDKRPGAWISKPGLSVITLLGG